MSATHLHADGNEVLRFVDPLFRYADEGTYANLRGFDQLDSKLPPKLIQPIRINGDLSILVEAATKAAERVANDKRAIVFCPPVCTFSNPDGACGADLANGLTLSVEIDDGDMQIARQKLEALLGPATIIVASGGEWIDPATGEVHPKLHLHWRLSEPTRDQDDHEKLRHARDMAAKLVGADPTGKPIVHCLRWPGSWNRKAEPRLAKIIAANENAEINLNDAAERLEEAIEAAGLASVKSSQSGPTGADTDRVASAMGAIPNAGTDIHYRDWIRFGYAVHRATAGTGFDIWDAWSQKSDKYNAAETEAAWRRIDHAVTSSRAPRTIGAGTIIFHAKAAGWKELRQKQQSPFFDPWAELQPPTFPIDALPPVLRDFAEDRARIIGADPCALAWAAISAASAALDGGVRLKMKRHDTWTVPPAIWVALVGRPSTKKSPIIDAAWEPLQRAQKIDIDQWRQQVANWKALPKDKRDPDEPKPKRRLVSHDATMEALQDILGRQNRGIGVLRDELAGWLAQLEKYGGAKAGGADRAFFLQAFNGGPSVIDRVVRGLTAVDNLLVAICGGIQPDRLRQFADLTDDGLWQRFVTIIVAPATRGLDERPGRAVADYADAINRMLAVPGATRVELSEGAHTVRAEVEQRVFDLEQSDVLGARFASFCGKLVGIWGRLCLVLNYLDPDDTHFVVPQRTAERASALLFQSVIPCAARVYAATGGGGADIEATRSVAGYILTKHKVRVLASDLAHNVRACRGQPLDNVQRVVSPLVAGGWLTPEKDWNPYAWKVAPDVHEQFAARAEREKVRRSTMREVITGQRGDDE